MEPTLNPDPALIAALRSDLSAAGYRADAVRSVWGSVADTAVGHGLHGPALAALAPRTDALATLARLLFLGVRTDRDAVARALPTLGAHGLVDLGFARIDGDAVAPTVLVRPQDVAGAPDDAEWWIASDLDEAALGGPLPTGHVLGVGGASLALAGLQLTTPAGRVLDVGTGCGIQALRAHLALRTQPAPPTIVATDVSPRALEFTRINALLNEVEGIETRLGSLFEPVAGEQFDRVVSNPPFVITPRVAGVPEYEYRDAGYAGDDLVAAFVSGVGAVLGPGGTAQLLGNWEYRAGQDGLQRVREWVAASPVPLEAWVIERERLDPLAYAELWVRDGGTAPGTAGYGALVDAWLADFAAREVDAVGFGYLLLRRPASAIPALARYERITHPLPEDGALGAHLGAALAAFDTLEQVDDAALAAARTIVADDVTEARHHLPGAEAPSVIELRQGGGLGRTLEVDPALAALVGASDGELTVGQLSDAIAELLEVDAAALRADLLPRVRELVFIGMLRLA
ncbi:methyltransferase [Microbacterium sp. SCN 69-37]|uniref:DUF7059 domain-containing protein n=1 Tax=Microbacterium sp. SCN 69-37 TaxID=1660115 RepID=UPI00086EF901|nr:methyltransferase [Microbacterium sp. SCN 69-37]ODT24828.1 MAG: SAM-dependent methyltransferase [Microbacterium sp. SCN 69-37]